jgi:hypothetical protein
LIGECTEHITIAYDNIRGKIQDIQCRKVESDCEISFRVSNLYLGSSAYVSIELLEKDSYCSDIYVKVQTSSSIPDETSSITTYILSDKNKLFRGYDPTVIHLLMTPSLFLSDTDIWESEAQGYHISQVQNNIKGSQIDFTE